MEAGPESAPLEDREPVSDLAGAPVLALRSSLFLTLGPVAFFGVAAAYGVLERHFSTDTWIALAGGRYMVTHGVVPRVDTFSFTFEGQPWLNQNWLAHLLLYWLYEHVHPNAVVLAAWLCAFALFLLILLATWIRSRSALGALIAAALVAVACQRYLGPRPATLGFFSLAALWACLAAVSRPNQRRAAWIAALILPLLVFWGCAHGSFIFGYGLVGLFIGCWVMTGVFRRSAARASFRAVAAVGGATAAALVITLLAGPYRLENLTHQFKIAGSNAFRNVAEWRPPYVSALFPPVWPFWTLLGIAAASFLTAGALRWLFKAKAATAESSPQVGHVQAGGRDAHPTLDIAAVGVALAMAFSARRFTPLFYILATPAVVTWLVMLTRATSASVRHRVGTALRVSAWAAAVTGAGYTGYRAYAEFIAPYADRPRLNLLERTIRAEQLPDEIVRFLERNELRVNVWCDWPIAGALLFHAPMAKVFIDGRAQQVYSDEHYLKNSFILDHLATQPSLAVDALQAAGTDAVLLRRTKENTAFAKHIQADPGWRPVLYTAEYLLFLRMPSRPFTRLGFLEQTGAAWWPDSERGRKSRAALRELLRLPAR